MPELPEVETVRRTLAGALPGKRIAGVEVLDPKSVEPLSPGDFGRTIRGRVLTGIGRRGKYLLLFMSPPLLMTVHLRMTGALVHADPAQPSRNHLRLLFHLDDGTQLRFHDQRRFGRVRLVETEGAGEAWEAKVEYGAVPGKGFPPALGPEPFSPAFTEVYLGQSLRERRASIKAILLDQRLVAGLGNIYADECLFRAGVHPARPASGLSREEVKRLHAAIRDVLEEAIRYRGTTFSSYVDGRGMPGRYAERLRVYRRDGQPCPECGTPVERMRIGGRNTRFCPRCQR